MHIQYLLAEDDIPGGTRYTVSHLLNEAEAVLLRCFTALLYFPATAEEIVPEKGLFIKAVTRFHSAPSFRKAKSNAHPPEQLWRDLLELPLLVVMARGTLPVWLEDLATARPVSFLSPNEPTVKKASQIAGVSAGLLGGLEDIREFYRTFRDLCRKRCQDLRLDEEIRNKLTTLSELDLFVSRSRLDFFPAFPLPQPWNGRSAAYLLNRFSNNVDRPTLSPDHLEEKETVFPELLMTSIRAGTALALFESRAELPPAANISMSEVEEVHTALLSHIDSTQKFRAMLELGNRMSHTRSANLFVTAPAVRLDVMRGRLPEGAKLDPNFKKSAKPGLQAVTDFIKQAKRNTFGSAQEKQAYENAHETLLMEHRFLACQTAYLASRSASVPLQLPPLPGDMFNKIRDLNQALEANSRKCPELFREVERELANLLPLAMRDWLYRGDSTVVLFSDLPFEWALIDEWPLCLTRPVSRIPIGITSWDILSAVLENPVTVNARTPDRVLVLDLIEQHDPIRYHSDIFASTSKELAHNYTYAKPANAAEFRKLVEQLKPDIVVLDTHGRYDRSKDEVWISLPSGLTSVDQLLPDVQVPPVWILSACDTSVTGAMRGCFVRRLLAKGAVCVIASLARVDALTASIFVGRLLNDIFSPNQLNQRRSLDQVIFSTQLTTALLYDPLLPLIRKAPKDKLLRQKLGNVLEDYLAWATQVSMEARQFRHAAAWILGESMARHGLTKAYIDSQIAGNIRPETLLFSAFGVPSHVELSL